MINPAVATYEQNKKGPSYFYRKREADSDGTHTKTLKL